MKHALLLLFVVVFASLGIATVVADLVRNGELHFWNAVLGFGALLLALAMALPVKLGEAVAALTPAAKLARDVKDAC